MADIGDEGVHRYRVREEPPAVTYAPSGEQDGTWVLSASYSDGRVELYLRDHAMHELWTEVRGVPWPNPALPGDESRREQDRLVRQLVHYANAADIEMLRDALEALGVRDP